MRNDLFIPEHKTNILPLRWLANYIFHPVSMWFFKIGLKSNDKLEHDYLNATAFDKIKEFVGFRLYKILNYPYDLWGTIYKMDLGALNLDLYDGLGWDDYDRFGIPYWDYFWHEDPETGDAWRLVLKDGTSN